MSKFIFGGCLLLAWAGAVHAQPKQPDPIPASRMEAARDYANAICDRLMATAQELGQKNGFRTFENSQSRVVTSGNFADAGKPALRMKQETTCEVQVDGEGILVAPRLKFVPLR